MPIIYLVKFIKFIGGVWMNSDMILLGILMLMIPIIACYAELVKCRKLLQKK